MAGGGGDTLEYTPTWVVAAVCTVIVAISLAVERLLHFGGTFLKRKHQKPLFEALQKVKEELMLLGFISLLLTVFQGLISKLCVPKSMVKVMLPCKRKESTTSTSQHFQTFFGSVIPGPARRLLAESASAEASYCAKKDKAPFLSIVALHHLHIFIFVLAIAHVTFSVCTVVFAGARIRQWKQWEKATERDNFEADEVLKKKVTHVQQHAFIKDHFVGIGKDNAILGWVRSFFKQFFGSLTKSDYMTLRLGFITTHCKGNPKFNFHKYMIRALEDDFKKVVGISWYLWVFVIIFLLLNVDGLNAYFWIAFLPFILLLAVGTKLEHVITQLAHEVAEKHIAIEGDLVVQPSDDHFWFHRPQIVLFLIHFILFQNAFEIGFFFWIWVQYGFSSCIMGKVRYIIPRLVMGVIIQVLCSYSTLPLYAIVTQMGSSFKKSIFEEHVQVGLVGWAQKAKRKGFKPSARAAGPVSSPQRDTTTSIELGNVLKPNGNEIQPDDASNSLPK